MSRCWRLHFGKLASEIFQENLLQSSTKLDGLLSNDVEALIQRFEVLLCDKSSCLQSLLNIWIFGCLADFSIQLRAPLRIPASVTQEHKEHFLWIPCHICFSLKGFVLSSQ